MTSKNNSKTRTQAASKQKKKKKNRFIRNKEIILTTYLFVFLFLGMMSYIGYYVYNNQETMINNSYNEGQRMLVSQNSRGSIYSADGEILAKTEKKKDGSEVRVYPFGNLYAHVVGYSTKGKTGVEQLANYNLIQSNIPLNERMENDIAGKKNPGDSVITTLNSTIQEAANKAMGVYDGAIIASDPKTGKILAMLSKPDFDPSEIADIWEELLVDDTSSVLLNRATQGLYPPGSTFKIVTAYEYIHENPDSYDDYHFNCSGSITIDGNKIRCYHGQNHGSEDFTKSFAKSCNSSFANISQKIDWTEFSKNLDRFGFGKDLGFDMDSSISNVINSAEITADDKMQTCIGQGQTLMTPLHLNMITMAIANDGVLMSPYIMDRVENVNGVTVRNFGSSGSKTWMTQSEAQVLQNLMKEVVEKGTATKLSGQNYTAAGKTGSAEYNSNSDSHAWFTGFAPAEDPEICVTVLIEDAGSGGDYAVPVARRVFDAYFNGK